MVITQLTKTGAALNRGRSRQDYSTPWPFIHAVEKRFGKIDCDLAASVDNRKAETCYMEEQDSLVQPWHNIGAMGGLSRHCLLWLNPPFANITPWAKKCYEESLLGAHILLLVPASVGSNWFAEYVHEKARVMFLRPRLVFEGEKDPYPRDLMIAEYTPGTAGHWPTVWYKCWKWIE